MDISTLFKTIHSFDSLSHVSLRVIFPPLSRPPSLLTPPPQPDPPRHRHSFDLSAPHVSLSEYSPLFYRFPDAPIPLRLPNKRKASEEPDGPNDGVSSSSKDFEAGRVTCEACGDSVSYRDERTGVFTTKHWDAHKLGW